MINYIFPVIAAVLMLLILSVVPLKVGTKLLIKVVIVSLLIFVLTYLLYSLYSLYVAGAGFIFLLLYFSYLISSQHGFASKQEKVYSPALDVSTPKQEIRETPAIAVEKDSEPPLSLGGLNQDGIDALIEAATNGEVTKEEEELLNPAVRNSTQLEDNKESIASQFADIDQVSITEQGADHVLTDSSHLTPAIKLTLEDLHDAELETAPMENLDNEESALSPESDSKKVALLEINSSEMETAATVEVDQDQEKPNLASEIERDLESFQIDREPLAIEEDLEEKPVAKETLLQKRSKLFADLENDL